MERDVKNLTRTRCEHCGIEDSSLPEGAKLKRCGGCMIFVFCSKECQKAAWPNHKLLCQQWKHFDSTQAHGDETRPWLRQASDNATFIQRPTRLQEFSTPMTLIADLDEFLESHIFAIQIIMRARVHYLLAADGGAQRLLHEPHVMQQLVISVKVPSPNASNQWMLGRWHLDPLGSRRLDDDPDLEEPRRSQRQASFRAQDAFYKAICGPSYITSIPVRYSIEGTNFTSIVQYPVWALRDPTAMLDPANHRVAEDLATLCEVYVNDGVSLRSTAQDPIAIGRYIKRNRKREWVPVVEDDSRDGAHERIKREALHELYNGFNSLQCHGLS